MTADPGLQTERTALAWRRTGLSLFVGALVMARLAIADSAHIALGVIAVAMAGITWTLMITLRRNRLASVSSRDPRFRYLLRDGRLPAVMALATGLLALVELAQVTGAVLPIASS